MAESWIQIPNPIVCHCVSQNCHVMILQFGRLRDFPRIKWSKKWQKCPSAACQKWIVIIYSNLQYDLILQSVHQNRLVLVWGCLRHTSRLIDFIHCHSLWRVQPGFVSLILQRPKDWFFSQRARSESSDPHKLQPQWFMGTFHVWVTCETCPI